MNYASPAKRHSGQHVSNQHYGAVSLAFKLADLFLNPKRIMGHVEIAPGACIPDCGCGPSSYTRAAANLVAESGKVHTVDIYLLLSRGSRQSH